MSISLHGFVMASTQMAQKLGLECSLATQYLSNKFSGETGVEALKASNLPIDISAASLGRYPVLFGLLPPAPDVSQVRDLMRRYRNQAVVARSHMPSAQAVDLQIWLLGPDGSEYDADWRALALAIERDDRVARKLVWLPPEKSDEVLASFAEFIGRTFLARPWRSVMSQSPGQLDRLTAVLAGAADLGIDQAVLSKWFELAASSEISDGPDLVDALVDSWPEENVQ